MAQLAEYKDPKRLEAAIKYQTRDKGPRGWTYEFANRMLEKLAACQGDTEAFEKIMLNAIMLHPYLQYRVPVEKILDLKQPIHRAAQLTCKPHQVTNVTVITREDDIFLIVEIPEFRGSFGEKRLLETRVLNEISREIPQLRSIRFRVEIG